MTDLSTKQCQACEGGVEPLNNSQVSRYLQQVNPRWSSLTKGHSDILHIQAEFQFKNYYETTAFINAVIWVAHQQDHHPDIEFGYNSATIHYTTHAIDGLSENDFICAAKIDKLLD